MTLLRWNGYLLQHDRRATANAFEELIDSTTDYCRCNVCRNFVEEIETALTPEVKGLFSSLGIPPKYANQYYIGRDSYTGRHRYGGWYYFIGEAIEDGGMHDVGGFRFEIGTEFPDPPEPFRSELDVLAIDFQVELSWGIGEPEPTPPITHRKAAGA